MQKRFILGVVLVVTFMNPGPQTLAAEQNQKIFSYDDYAPVLKAYVDDNGMVNYKQLKANRSKLDAFIDAMAKLDAKTFEKWDEKAKIAFWLNAYNAFTLKAIIDNYPIKPSFWKSRIYPANSIRQIPGVWNKITFKVMIRNLTLSDIEHKILRKQFDEPRIHMAMVCAAMGCPILINEPYIAEKLDDQLDDQTRRFLQDPNKFRIDRRKDKVYLSPILDWFAEDFVNKYSPAKKIPNQNIENSAVLNFLINYLDEDDKDYILSGNFKLKHLK
jgi:hypothetical protein